MAQKSILVIGNFLSRHGVNPQVGEEMAQQLAENGWHVVTASDKMNRLLRFADMLYTVWRCRHDYEIAHIDVFSGPSFLWAEYSAHLLQQLGKPYSVSLHGGNLPNFSAKHPERVRKFLVSANAVTAPSRYLVEQMQNYHDDILYVPNPVPLANYINRPRQHAAPKLVWVRAFHEIYNPMLALHVLAQLQPDFPGIHLYMVGPDKDGTLASFLQLADELNLRECVTIAGRVDKSDIPGWLDKGDVFINTTNVDNTPISVIEAMASGLCIVSTRVGGIPYLLDDGENALLVPPDDVDAMTGAVRQILIEPTLAAQLSQGARRKAETYDWAVILKQWEAIFYEKVVPASKGKQQ